MQGGSLPGGYGWYLVQTLLALVAVCLIAYVALRFGLRRLSAYGQQSSRVRVLERAALDSRRSLFLVEVGGRLLLLGSGEGPMTLLAEIDPATLPPVPAPRRIDFRQVLARARRTSAPPAPPADGGR